MEYIKKFAEDVLSSLDENLESLDIHRQLDETTARGLVLPVRHGDATHIGGVVMQFLHQPFVGFVADRRSRDGHLVCSLDRRVLCSMDPLPSRPLDKETASEVAGILAGEIKALRREHRGAKRMVSAVLAAETDLDFMVQSPNQALRVQAGFGHERPELVITVDLLFGFLDR